MAITLLNEVSPNIGLSPRSDTRKQTSSAIVLLRLVMLCLSLGMSHFVNAFEYPESADLSNSALIDLRNVTWGQGETHSLAGSWDLYWQELIDPIAMNTTASIPRPFPVPGVWNDHFEPLPAKGYGTYKVNLLVPQNLTTYYLRAFDMPSAYKLWANGKLIASNGKVGTSKETEVAAFLPKIAEIEANSGQIELILQISNFHYKEGGVWFSFELTDQSGFYSVKYQPIILAVIFSLLLITTGFYNLSMFAARTKEYAALAFGGLCFVIGIRRLLIDERVLYYFDWASWSTLQRIEHWCFYLAMPCFISFFYSLFPTKYSRTLHYAAWVAVVPFILLAAVTPVETFTQYNVTFQFFIMVFTSFSIVAYFGSVREKRPGVIGFGISLALMVITVVHDVLKANDFFDTPNIVHFGVIAFVVTQGLALQRRFLNNLSVVEEMSKTLAKRNEELVRLDEFKDEFLATTSHELRTPLHGISGLANLLKEKGAENLNEEQKYKIDLIASSSKRLGLLVNDILDFSSIKHGKLQLHFGVVDFGLLVEGVIATLKPVVGRKPIRLTSTVDHPLNRISIDEFRMQQILFNLMGNAIKFTAKGSVHLGASLGKEGIKIRISDTGIGIAEDKQNMLFKPFEQIQHSPNAGISGSGLGLSISKKLVELHGGELTLFSEEGVGTRVIITLPESLVIEQDEAIAVDDDLADEHKNVPILHERLDIPTLTHHITVRDASQTVVFVVDDEEVNRELVSSHLLTEDYYVETFASGPEVLTRLEEEQPALIVLDYMMPEMDGLEVCRQIRQRWNTHELPIMMLTARHQIRDIVEALGAGANDYLIKPYHDKELLTRVELQMNARNYWLANEENTQLREEITRRNGIENQLSESNSRMRQILDLSEDVVYLLNQDLECIYINKKASNIAGGMLIGNDVSRYLGQNHIDKLNEFIANDAIHSTSVDSTGTPFKDHKIHVNKFCEAGQIYVVLMLARIGGEPVVNTVIADLTEELTQSRRKIDQIEQALQQINLYPPNTSDVGTATEAALQREELEIVEVSDDKELIVQLLRTSLNVWERMTGLGKPDLAEQSRCWRVYLDGTTVKTRTFDKYLSLKTIPDKPRWRSVVRTANFVLANCELSEEDRSLLVSYIQSVEDAFS